MIQTLQTLVAKYRSVCLYVSESYIFGPIDDFSDIENFASFERAMFEDFQIQNKNITITYMLFYHHIDIHT